MSQVKRFKPLEDTTERKRKKRRVDFDRSVNTNDEYGVTDLTYFSPQLLFEKVEVPGTILRIHLKNFMCHVNLEVIFNPKINFILGRNGSGKSAILTAVVLVLGGNASATSRASSIKDFVKKGATIATIEIVLNNKGFRAYKNKEYGNTIIITRTINALSGQSHYKIRSTKGELKSTKKEDLDKIVNYFNIQIDNPISVLNQDTARTFLSNSDPSEKYKLYKKATRLQVIEEEYKKMLRNHEEVKRMYQLKKQAAEVLKAEIKDLKKRSEFFNSLANHGSKIRMLENELHWSLVIREENLYNQLKTDLEVQAAKSPVLKQEVEKYNENLQIHVKKNRDFVSELNVLEQEEAKILNKLNAAKDNEKTQNHSTSQIYKLYKEKENLKKRLDVDITTLQQEIMKITNISGTNYAQEKKKLEEKIQKLEESGGEIDARIKTSDLDYHQLRSAISSYVTDQKSLQAEEREMLQLVEKKKRQIHVFEREDRDAITVYGSWMQSLLAKIDELHKNRKFERKPLGPLGSFIKLKDSTWAPAVENFLSARFLSSFCVHSSNDAKVLNALFNSMKIERSPNLLIGKFFDTVHNVGPNKVFAPGYSCLLDALIISNPVVANCVIDQFGAESILLIPTSDEAHHMMGQRERVPQKCSRAITKRGDLYFPDPNYKSYAGSGSERAKLLQVSRSDAIRNFKEELTGLENKLKDIELQTESMNKKITDEQRQLQQINAVRNSLTKEKLRISKELSELKTSVEPESSSLSTLVEELEEIKKRYVNVEEEAKKLKEQYEKSHSEVQKCKKEILDLQKDNQKIISAATSIKEKINANENNIQTFNMKLTAAQKSYDTQLEKINHMETNLEMREQRCRTAAIKASELCPRIDTERSSNSIYDELNNIKEYVKHFEERETSSKEEVLKALEEKTQKISEIDIQLSKLDKSFEKFPAALENRNTFMDWLRKYIVTRVQCVYLGSLWTRKFSGHIKIDDEAEKMYVSVFPSSVEGGAEQRAQNDVKSLSGGERSFSTVSLILALWTVAEPPFYFLDEFDVFMDKVNRQVIMDLLLCHSASDGFQYVFLTPQDSSSVIPTKDITFHCLEAPKRRNPDLPM